MKVTKKETQPLTYLVTVEIEKNEANEKKAKQLKEYRKKAEIKGFRKGMAPMGLIEKLYGPSAMNEAVNDLITEGINNHIKENNLDLIGEPLPNEELQKQIDIEKDEKFEFLYDMAVRPKVEVALDKKDKVVYYQIKVEDQAVKQYKDDMLRQFGSLEDTEKAGGEDFLVVDLEQGDKKVEKTYITLKSIDEKNKKQFVGKKVGDSFDVDVVKCFPNETDRASLLRISKDEFDASNPVYTLTVKEVKTFTPAKIDQNLFDRAFGKDAVKDEKEFDKALEEKLKSEYKQESDWRFRRDLIDYIVKKADITLPEDFLKRWLFRVNDGKFTMEQIEKEFPLFLQDYRWQMITRKFFEDQKMKISREDLLGVAKEMTANQFAMYGIPNVPAETVNQYAEQMLNNEKELNRVYEKCEEDKVLDYVKSVITADVKDVTRDEMAIINDNAAPKAEKPAKKAPAKKTAAKKAVKDEAAEEEAPKAEKPARKRTAKAKKEE
ncbi:MAG: trigger factor [Bacteroidales bacterium]|nr:trigger factor [Bacteroidales bacterium]